jgi:glycosyltransferase involved in cell wall biosynthesis
LRKARKFEKKLGYRMILDIRTIPVTHSRLRSAVESYFFGKSVRFAADNFSGVTYVTAEMKYHCKKKYGLPEHKSLVWNSGVNAYKFTPQRKKLGRETFILIYHGSMTKNRGVDKLIKALALLESDDIRLLLLGSGKALSYLKRLASRFKMDRKVLFEPPVPYEKVTEYINRADAGVLPFPDWEGWNTSSPIKLFEYLACGRPVIATKIPAHVSVLKGRDFVFWAEDNSPEKLADAVKRAYEARNRYEELAGKSREFIKHEYTWDIQAEKLERFLKELNSEY